MPDRCFVGVVLTVVAYLTCCSVLILAKGVEFSTSEQKKQFKHRITRLQVHNVVVSIEPLILSHAAKRFSVQTASPCRRRRRQLQ